MIKTRLLKQLGSSSRYILWQILCQWLALLGQIAFIFALAKILTGHPAWLLLLLGAAVQLLGQYAYNQASFRASARVKEVLRGKIYAKLLRLGSSFQESIKPSELVQLTGEGIESVDSYFSRYLSQFAYAFLAPLTLFAVFVRIDAPASITLLCAVPLIPIVIMVVMLVAKKILNRYFAIYHQLADTFLEKMQGMTSLKVYGADSQAEAELAAESEHFRRITMKVLTMQLLSTVVMDTVAYGGAACGIAVALNEIRLGRIGRQEAIVLILLAAAYFLPMRQLGSYFHIGMNGMKASDQIFAFLDLPEAASGQAPVPDKTDIAVRGLSFTYPGADKPALSQISLTIPAAGFTAIVGLSGSGKSTLATLLAGRQKASQGQITVGGLPLDQISASGWLQAVTLVSADSYLFKGSVRDNLLMAGPA
ncbi:ABC transporter ATP-binding protein/permease, partial [Lactobacillus nasalidis]